MFRYTPQGICAQAIDVDIDGDTIKSVQFYGGCNGNLKAISKLVAGQKIDDMASLLEGNTCGYKNTSCADQLIKALRAAQAAQ